MQLDRPEPSEIGCYRNKRISGAGTIHWVVDSTTASSGSVPVPKPVGHHGHRDFVMPGTRRGEKSLGQTPVSIHEAMPPATSCTAIAASSRPMTRDIRSMPLDLSSRPMTPE